MHAHIHVHFKSDMSTTQTTDSLSLSLCHIHSYARVFFFSLLQHREQENQNKAKQKFKMMFIKIESERKATGWIEAGTGTGARIDKRQGTNHWKADSISSCDSFCFESDFNNSLKKLVTAQWFRSTKSQLWSFSFMFWSPCFVHKKVDSFWMWWNFQFNGLILLW